jgi:hypothetical protein
MPARSFPHLSNRCLSKQGRLRCEGVRGHVGPHENDGIRWVDLATESQMQDVETGERL